MIAFIIYLFLVVLATHVLGWLVVGTRKNELQIIAPVVGLAMLLLVLSPLYYFQLPTIYPFLIVLVGVLAGCLAIRRVAKPAIRLMVIQLVTLCLIALPYVQRFGREGYITGYFVSNDSVMHAIMSRSKNDDIADKIFGSDKLDLAQYPRATHALVNFLSWGSGIETSYLIIPTALLFVSYTVFPLLFLILLFSKNEVLGYTFPIIAAASYYPLAIGYHGFLPQAGFVVFVISVALLGWKAWRGQNWRHNGLIISMLIAASVATYRFVSYLPIVLVLGSLSIFFKDWKRLLALILGTIVLMPIDTWISIQQVWLVISGQSVIAKAVQDSGNLSGYIPPGILSGVWFESDYRYMNPDRMLKYLPYALVVPLGYFALVGMINLWRRKQMVAWGITTLLASVVIVAAVTGSPYSTGKMLSLLAPVVPILIVGGMANSRINSLLRTTLISVMAVLMISSNNFLLRGISAMPTKVFEEMKQIKAAIQKAPTIVYSDNDWLSYYLDSPDVDITELHYLPDKIKPGKQYRYEVYEKPNHNVEGSICNKILELTSFIVCLNIP